MAENRARFSADFTSSGADKLKRDLEDVRQGRKDLNDVIGNGARVSQEAAQGMDASAQATQAALKTVEDSTRALQAAFAALPQGVQQSLAQVMDKVRQADFMEAMLEKAKVRGVPQTFSDQLNSVAQASLRATTVQPEADVAATIQQTLPQPKTPQMAAQGRTQAPDGLADYGIASDATDPARPTPILRSAVEALKQGDLDRARDHQRLAARTALRTGDREAQETSTRLTRALREAQDKDNGVVSGQRYAATLKNLEERLEAAEAAEADTHGPYLAPKTAMGRAQRTLSTAHATLSGGISRGSDITGLETQLGRMDAYLGQAEQGGAKGRDLDDLKEQLEKLTDQLGKTRDAYQQAQQQGGAGQPRQPDAPAGGGGGGLSGDVLDELKRFAGSGMGGGFMGRTLMRLGPYGMVAGAALAGNSLAERMVAAPNREARQRYAGDVDLARQYGYDGDPLVFRDGSSGLSDQRLIEMGYTSSEASTTLARLDTPADGGIAGAKEDTYDALQFARSTGLDQGQVASALTSLREAGAYKVGAAQEPLEVIKMALTEAVKNGVSQADTLRALVDISEQQLREGRSSSAESLAMQAALQARLAKTGEKTLQGDTGAEAQATLNSLITGGNDPAMMMLLAPAVEGMTAEDLGLEGAAAEGYTQMQAHSPLEAAFTALELLEDGRNPEASARLATRLDDALGGNAGLYNSILEKYGLGAEQRLTAIGSGGVGEIYEDAAAAATGEFAQGEALESDVQGENETAQRSREVQARERDVQESKGTGTLNAFGDVGEIANELKTRGVAAWRNFLSQGGLYDDQNRERLEDDGSLSNAPKPEPTPTPPVEIEPPQRWQDRIDLIPGWDWLPGLQRGEERRDGTRALTLPDVGAMVAPGVPIPIPDVDATVAHTEAHVRPVDRSPVRSVDDKLQRLDPRHAVAMAERQQLRAQGALAEMSMGPGVNSAEVRLTNQPGSIYGEEIAGVMGHDHVGERHQGVDVVIGEAGRPDPIYNPFEQATIMTGGESELGGNFMVVQAPDGESYKLAHLDEPFDPSRIGEVVPRGGVLGIEGMSGAATGYHAHLELWDDMGGEQGVINRRDNQDPQRFYERFYNSLEVGQPTASREAEPVNGRIDVHHHGLDNVRVEGLEPSARQRAEAALREFGTAIRSPTSHNGFG